MRGATVGTALFSPEELAQATGGRFARRAERRITAVATDSRQVHPGCLFVPLAGSRTDGHRFLVEAMRRGASALLVAGREWEARQAEVRPEAEGRGVTVVLVDEPLQALQDLARRHIRRWPRLERFAITGSSGKTTTKEILGAILSREGPTVVNEGNLNSEIGLPLAVFRAGYMHRFAVFELGINHAGEMDILADIVRPDAALVTNIGRAHIGLLGSVERIAEEKKKIFRCFDGRQKAFLFEDDPFREMLARGIRGKVIPFGPRSTPGFEGSRSLGLDGTVIHWEGLQIRFPLSGRHNLLNALAAMAVAIEWGASADSIAAGLESVQPLFGRSQILRGEITLVHDCYNSNPDSVERLLEFIRTLEWTGRKVAVLGSMLELGEESEPAHRQAGEQAAGAGLDAVFFVGPEMEAAYRAFCAAGGGTAGEWHRDLDPLAGRLRQTLRPGDLVVMKASRGVELERLIPVIQPAGR